jgi:glyoxylase-like metal-dependent hydrolase (beta-lactamase superfamily II)
MERLWGEVAPVPEENITVLQGGETLEGGFKVEYAPGHASHHVVYLHEESGDAFVGDVGGVRVPPYDFTLAPTPPPDIDIEKWNASLDMLEEWGPKRLCLTHFGEVDTVGEQVETVRAWLRDWGPKVRELGKEQWCAQVKERMHAEGDEIGERLEQAAPPDQLWLGLDRYWRKKDEREAA